VPTPPAGHSDKIAEAIQGLKIPSLKAFTGKIGDNIEDDPPLDALVWKGAIAAAELQIEIERVWQSGNGKWFAVLESFHSSDERNVTDVRHVEHRECDGKMAAVWDVASCWQSMPVCSARTRRSK
jgi:hypothetical protein